MPKKTKCKKKNIRKFPHVNHRSGAGQHDSRPKRLRTRQNITKKEIDNKL